MLGLTKKLYYTALFCCLGVIAIPEQYDQRKNILCHLIPFQDPSYSAISIVKDALSHHISCSRYTHLDVEYAWRALYDFISRKEIHSLLLDPQNKQGQALRWLISQLYNRYVLELGKFGVANSHSVFALYIINGFTNSQLKNPLCKIEQAYEQTYQRYMQDVLYNYADLEQHWQNYWCALNDAEKVITQYRYYHLEYINDCKVIKTLRFLLEMRRLSWQVFAS